MAWRNLLAVLSLLSLTAAAGAAGFLIEPDGSGDYATIQEALTAAAPGDTVYLGAGVFLGDGNRDLDFGGQAIVLRSLSGDPTGCTIDCQGSEAEPHRAVDFLSGEGPDTVLEGLTLTGGYADGECCEDLTGGAIRCQFESSPTIRRCIFDDNFAVTAGGAILCSNYSSPSVEECVFTRNQAALGGAVTCGGFGSPTFIRCTFYENGATTLPGNGGAICVKFNTALIVTECTFFGNSAQNGSSLHSSYYAEPELEHSIFAFGLTSEAVYSSEDSSPLFTCCDIYGNEGGDWTGGIADQLGVAGNFSADPLFCDPGLADFRLYAESPCLPGTAPTCGLIGAWPIGCPATDVPEPPRRADLWLQLQPNPTAGSAHLTYRIPGGEHQRVCWEVLDPAGRRLRTLCNTIQSPGEHQLDWDGRDPAGAPLPSGIYYHRLRVGGLVRTIPAVLLK